MKVSGWALANVCSTSGIELIGTNALDRNENGTARMLSPCAAWALPLTSPSQTKTEATARA